MMHILLYIIMLLPWIMPNISSAFSERNFQKDSQSIFKSLKKDISENDKLLKEIIYYLDKNHIDIHSDEWIQYIQKKCSWVKENIDIEAYGEEDKFSYDLCIITEQNSLIFELISLFKDERNPFFSQKNKYRMKLIEQKQNNLYFNELAKKMAKKFCTNYELPSHQSDCFTRIISHQFVPEEYDFTIITDKAYLFSTPPNNKSKMYLIKNDKVKLLKKNNDFYYIQYDTRKKGIIKKWLHCSAIDACSLSNN